MTRLFSLLRAGVLAMLMLGIVAKPLLGSLCEIHALADVVAGLVAEDLAGPGHENDRDHDRGAHDQLHEDNNSGAYAEIAGVIIVPPARLDPMPPPRMDPSRVLAQPLANPFRPPIS